MRPLLVLRPEPGWRRTAARAEAAGWPVCGAPLFTIVPLAWEPPDAAGFDALLLTSPQAAAHAGAALAAYAMLPCFCVGTETAAAARAAGLSVRHAGSGDVREEASAIRDFGHSRALHLCGREHREVDLAGIAVTAVPVYAADPVERMPEAVRAGIDRGAIALLHSPRAAALFASLVDQAALARSRIDLAAISEAARDAAGTGWRRASAAEHPTDAALLAAAAVLCDGATR